MKKSSNYARLRKLMLLCISLAAGLIWPASAELASRQRALIDQYLQRQPWTVEDPRSVKVTEARRLRQESMLMIENWQNQKNLLQQRTKQWQSFEESFNRFNFHAYADRRWVAPLKPKIQARCCRVLRNRDHAIQDLLSIQRVRLTRVHKILSHFK